MTLIPGDGVYFGGWKVTLQAAVAADPHGYDQPAATYDTPGVVYDGGAAAGMWATLDCQLLRVTATYGGQLTGVPGACASLGRLTASLYDPDRVLDPSASPYALLMRPGALVRLVAIQPVTGTIWPLWTGTVDTFSHDLLDGTGRLVASDMVAAFTGVDVENVIRPDETSVRRLQAALAIMPNPVPFTFSGIPVTVCAVSVSGDLWGALVAPTQRAEQSIVWVDQTGRLRRTDTQGLGPPVLAVDCDDETAPIIYTRLSTLTDEELLTNLLYVERANIGRVDRAPLKFADPASVGSHGAHSLTDTRVAVMDDTALAGWARNVLTLRATPHPAITGLAVEVADVMPWASRTVPALTRLGVGTVLDVRLSSRGEAGRWIVAVAGVSHTITPDAWVAELDVIDGPALVENWGYSDPRSTYDTTLYARYPGVAGPARADVRRAITRVLAEATA